MKRVIPLNRTNYLFQLCRYFNLFNHTHWFVPSFHLLHPLPFRHLAGVFMNGNQSCELPQHHGDRSGLPETQHLQLDTWPCRHRQQLESRSPSTKWMTLKQRLRCFLDEIYFMWCLFWKIIVVLEWKTYRSLKDILFRNITWHGLYCYRIYGCWNKDTARGKVLQPVWLNIGYVWYILQHRHHFTSN